MTARYLVGIDLGTTNSVLAYMDSQEFSQGTRRIRILDIPQLVVQGEVRPLASLPSFLYFPTEAEIKSGLLNLPWEEEPSMVVGSMARAHGALMPGRLVASAKSWLCQHGLNATAAILPLDAESPEPSISPVDASARYLMHLKAAWDHSKATAGDVADQLENQDIVLTVPASFDEEARELTVEAARKAGLTRITLLEEPLAAFYSWIAATNSGAGQELSDGDLVLVCDIGGGTSDFSLVRCMAGNNGVEFERLAIGEHLLLGGENLDLALAMRIESKLHAKLTLRQRNALQIACSAAKERLLSDNSLESLTVSILGSGSSVVGDMLSGILTREDVVDLLKTFLPTTAQDELPAPKHKAGLREVGLPYQADPAITKHLAAFLRRAALAPTLRPLPDFQPGAGGMAMPDAVLFNGGFCPPEIARDQILASISHWSTRQNWRPATLRNSSLDSAVAKGAAYYAGVRRGQGLRVKAGSARSYYVGRVPTRVPRRFVYCRPEQTRVPR
ncbi:MAG: Hsp70 family protein [Acidobacteriales bacterium]|nr:Hsp70 family protein [Terriglobales bacterium]